MANITAQNNIRYTIDTLNYETYGVLYTKSSLDFSKANSISGIRLAYEQPQLSSIHIAFKMKNIWYRIENDALKQISTTQPDINILREKGNTIQELEAVKDWSYFLGNSIDIAIGLYTTDRINAVPKITLSFLFRNFSQKLTYSEYSPIYEFDEKVTVNSINFQGNTTQGSSVKLYAKALLDDGSTVPYTETGNLHGAKIKSLQFRADYYVPDIQSNNASLEPVNVIYTLGSAITSGVTSGEIISITQNWYMNISQVRMTVQHSELVHSQLRAYCAFREQPIIVNGENLGNSTGARQTFTLKNTKGLKYDSIKLYYDNQRVYSDFEFNTQSGRVTCEAPEGVLISCSYEYNWGIETWQEMQLTSRYENENMNISEFRLNTEASNQSVCAVKIVLEISEGNILNEVIGRGTGITQTYKLTHSVKDSNIQIYSNGYPLSVKNWYLSDDPQYVKIAAPHGALLTAKYDWVSETPEVYQFAAVFGK